MSTVIENRAAEIMLAIDKIGLTFDGNITNLVRERWPDLSPRIHEAIAARVTSHRYGVPSPNILLEIGMLAGTASKLAQYDWIKVNCPTLISELVEGSRLLTASCGYPFPGRGK